MEVGMDSGVDYNLLIDLGLGIRVQRLCTHGVQRVQSSHRAGGDGSTFSVPKGRRNEIHAGWSPWLHSTRSFGAKM